MADESIACIIKSPIALQTGDVRTDLAKPGVYVIEVTFPRERIINLQSIAFKNYYTAFLTVRLQRRLNSESDRKLLKWKTCIRDMCLMPNPHTENGSQDYFSIHRDQMLFEPDGVVTVRLILRQPSPVWLNFTIEDIKMYECDHDKDKVQGPWLSQLTPQDRPLKLSDGLPDPEVVASSVQQMWVLTEMVRSNPATTRVGRFDVDGSYDVNLLSYT
ncbi:nicolin-1 isoform X1 [Hemiscyllium ocellatum]|uniref:nicolin-1 isoform X1 n=1 Tax=Hemiscyllium ocellatum TaxID=170820 RepID=UPI0029673729|nr:nicolin-1 isoform X1 [Hemiscyllium ocellatum]XP_060691227.1 nicolin-1 isoform X1 [Hemiscyllium ocellatum]